MRELMGSDYMSHFPQFFDQNNTPSHVIEQLPVRELTQTEVENNLKKQDEGLRSCLVCLCDYAPEEEVRTMPCLHFFHKECIDKWLGKSNSCPICKFDIKNNYNSEASSDL